MKRVIFCGIIVTLLYTCSVYGQSDNVKSALASKDYQSVIETLKSSNSIKNNAESLFARGQSYAELGMASQALPDLARAKTLGIKDPNIYKYLGKTYHLKNRHKEAIKWYKLYLENLPKNSKENIETILNLVKQCNYAEQIKSNESIIVQHCDGDINSLYDEERPIFSRTASNKLYYTISYNESNRIEGTEFRDGLWSTEANLPSAINAVGENYLNDISGDGQVLFFANSQEKKIYSLYNKLIVADKNIFFQAPYFPHLGDTDLQIVDNNTIVFSSLRPDSYGGYDIYISKFKAGKWTEPTNLGDEINSAYNDRSPFMTADSKKLYFSSDRLESLGGFDIFESSKSSVESKGYKKASNIGAPINSAGDDLHFRVDGNGLRCVFNSNRLGGKGGLDIYLAYLNIPSSKIIVDAAHLDYIKYENGQIVKAEVEEKAEEKTPEASKKVIQAPTTSSQSQITTQKESNKTLEVAQSGTKIDTHVDTEVKTSTKEEVGIPSKENKEMSKKEKAELAFAEKKKAKLEKKKKAELQKEAKRQENEAKMAEEKKRKESESLKYVDSSKKEKEKITKEEPRKQAKTKVAPPTQVASQSKPKGIRSTKKVELKRMIVPTLYYADEEAIFSVANRDKLDTIAKYFNLLPDDVVLELTNFTKKSVRKEYELFFSINQLDEVVEYLEDKGVSIDRMIVNSVGSSYPLAEANLGGQSLEQHLGMNQRIEATFYNVPDNVSEAKVKLDIPLSRQAKDYPIYKSVKDDVHYRLEFAETSHIFKNRVLTYYNDIIITRNLETQNYLYALGFFQTYSSALNAQRTMTAKNLLDTKIVAYNGSQRLNKSEVLKLAAKYASLRPFMDKI